MNADSERKSARGNAHQIFQVDLVGRFFQTLDVSAVSALIGVHRRFQFFFPMPAAREAAGITRHYALPGSERCVQCHMGSPSQSFILGFTPLQVARRPTGTSGVYEPASGDELTQLQRLIDYGVVSGMTSPDDVLPLEQSEGSRPPRNVYELDAQAYMVGNCAHCHNPRGFPSVRQPALKDVLVFLPGSGPNQGIFQFPLETLSPIRKRGLNQDVPVPYITPSIYDMPDDSDVRPSSSARMVRAEPAPPRTGRDSSSPPGVASSTVTSTHRTTTSTTTRSSRTCRSTRPATTAASPTLMGDWMVSIPARKKDPTKFQKCPSGPRRQLRFVRRHEPAALRGGPSRRQRLRDASRRHNDSPSAVSHHRLSIRLLPEHVHRRHRRPNHPVRGRPQSARDPRYGRFLRSDESELDHHARDHPDPSALHQLRRHGSGRSLVSSAAGLGNLALVNPDIPSFIAAETATDSLQPDAAEDLTNVMTALEGVTLTADVRSALTKQYPFGLWDTTVPGCDFSAVPTAGSFTGANKPQWMADTSPPASAPVYMASPGAAIFTSVCFNCHGINADSKGLLADEITDLTGGDARVADLRDGLLGPTIRSGDGARRGVRPGCSTHAGDHHRRSDRAIHRLDDAGGNAKAPARRTSWRRSPRRRCSARSGRTSTSWGRRTCSAWGSRSASRSPTPTPSRRPISV